MQMFQITTSTAADTLTTKVLNESRSAAVKAAIAHHRSVTGEASSVQVRLGTIEVIVPEVAMVR